MEKFELTEEYKMKVRKIQRKQMCFGLFCFALMLFIAFYFSMKLESNNLIGGLFLFIAISIPFLLFCLYFCVTLMSYTSRNDYSYFRVSDILIIFLRLFQFVIGCAYICVGLYLMSYFKVATILNIFLFIIFGNLLYLFVLSDDSMRKIHSFIVDLFHLDNSSYDKNMRDNVKIVYYPREKRFVYCVVNDDGLSNAYFSNSFDAFRFDFSSQITLLGMPINTELINLYREGRRTTKKYKCKKLKFMILPTIDENNNFNYVNKYYCKNDNSKYYSFEEIEEICKKCPNNK